ncbi:MAG: nucleoside-diphosphate sugar epimerase/dehydratase [Caldilinea sp.]
MTMRILILGGGAHAQTIADVILQLADGGQPLRVAGFLDDDPALHGVRYQGIAVLGPIAKVAIFDAETQRRRENAENRPSNSVWLSFAHLCGSAPLRREHPSQPDLIVQCATSVCVTAPAVWGTTMRSATMSTSGRASRLPATCASASRGADRHRHHHPAGAHHWRTRHRPRKRHCRRRCGRHPRCT